MFPLMQMGMSHIGCFGHVVLSLTFLTATLQQPKTIFWPNGPEPHCEAPKLANFRNAAEKCKNRKIQKISKIFRKFQKLSKIRKFRNFQKISENFRLLPDLSRTCPGLVPDLSRTCPGPVPDLSRTCPGAVPDNVFTDFLKFSKFSEIF